MPTTDVDVVYLKLLMEMEKYVRELKSIMDGPHSQEAEDQLEKAFSKLMLLAEMSNPKPSASLLKK